MYFDLSAIINRLVVNKSRKQVAAQPNMLQYDSKNDLHYICDSTYSKPVYISDRKRADLYKNGVQARIEWILSDYRIPLEIIQPGDLVVDIGANVGELALHSRFSGCKYIAIEPDPNAFKALSLNHPQGTLVNCALSNKSGILDFFLATANADSSLFRPEAYTNCIQVDVFTLDECMAHHQQDQLIKLLKIEAEGMEPEVLSGGMKTLGRTLYIAIDAGPERGGKPTAPECLNLLISSGFKVVDTYLLRGTFFLRNELLQKSSE